MIIVIFDKQTKNCCEKREKAWNVQPIQKTWGAETPHAPRFGRVHPIMTCTKWQVGCRSHAELLPTSTQRQSVGGRSAIRKGN